MKIIILSLFLFVSSLISAQNLQFNQVLILDGNSNTPSYTVPAGKVWKIESASISSGSGYFGLSINGSSVAIVAYANGGNLLPYWLPAGTNVGFYIYQTGKVSIIEFNVVP